MLRSSTLRLRSATTAAMSTTAAARAELAMLAENYRRWGHKAAALDPLALAAKEPVEELSLAAFPTLSNWEGTLDATGIVAGSSPAATVPQLVQQLEDAYCAAIGAELGHVGPAAERKWLADRLEAAAASGDKGVTTSARRNAHSLMMQAESFELFLQKRWSAFKRYSGEGAEAMLPALDSIFATARGAGVEEVVVGMPHRGRLAFMASMLSFPASRIFRKINGMTEFPEDMYGIDDVTSHFGTSAKRTYGGKPVSVSLLHNPSHLEAVNPVTVGKVWAKQTAGTNAMALQVHGDAAFSGQGIVPETLALSKLPGYSVAGSVHLVVNNQLGFTATADVGRSSLYCSCAGKAIGAPVLHVCAESMDDVLFASKLATDYRNTFGKDVIIDLIGFRRHGHNEVDEPAFTQPVMYDSIRSRSSFASRYETELTEAGELPAGAGDKLRDRLGGYLQAEFDAAKTMDMPDLHALEGKWADILPADAAALHATVDTGVDVDKLRDLAHASVALPDDFAVHPRLKKGHVDSRLKQVDSNAVDWATAEAMSIGSLLVDGFDVRMSGQDCQRGTFSHRHAHLTDQKTGGKYSPWDAFAAEQGNCSIVSSNLSEFAVMGFEYGVSWETPSVLPMWEAQFGDFNNGAQIIIDQFFSGGEPKWARHSALTLLLPHGYDGTGPEHSSARIERFLQLVDSPGLDGKTGEDALVNMSVAFPTTPASYFHLLRRQLVRPFRKPLVVIGPKTLLRDPRAKSSLEEMAPGTSFQPVVGDSDVADASRVIFCSGKFYYNLVDARTEAGDEDTAIIRLEELAPFPHSRLAEQVNKYGSAKEFLWVQEEPLNAGAWAFVEPHFRSLLPSELRYVGRPALPAPAVGIGKDNAKQTEAIISELW